MNILNTIKNFISNSVNVVKEKVTQAYNWIVGLFTSKEADTETGTESVDNDETAAATISINSDAFIYINNSDVCTEEKLVSKMKKRSDKLTTNMKFLSTAISKLVMLIPSEELSSDDYVTLVSGPKETVLSHMSKCITDFTESTFGKEGLTKMSTSDECVEIAYSTAMTIIDNIKENKYFDDVNDDKSMILHVKQSREELKEILSSITK